MINSYGYNMNELSLKKVFCNDSSMKSLCSLNNNVQHSPVLGHDNRKQKVGYYNLLFTTKIKETQGLGH